MEKKIVITAVILTAFINLYYFVHLNKNTADIALFDKTNITFYFDPSDDKAVSKPAFLKKLRDFSEENNVEIAQYSFLSSDNIDIYSTMPKAYKEALLIPGLIFNRNIKVHDFEELLDVGYKNLFYLNTKDMDIIQSLSDEVKDACMLYYSESAFNDNAAVFASFANDQDLRFLPVFILFIFVFALLIFFYYSKSRQAYVIYRLWGYTRMQVYHILNKPLYKPLFFTMILSSLAMTGILYHFVFSKLLLQILFMMSVFHAAIVLLLFLLSAALFSLSFAAVNNQNRKKDLSKMMITACASKFLLLLLIIFFCGNLFSQKAELQEKQDSLALWQNTKNLFAINESYSPFYAESLANEDILNHKILSVYKDLSESGKVFIIDTINFEHSRKVYNETADEPDYDYNYKINVKSEEDLYSPDGRNIFVDKNYLKRHPIHTADRKNVMDFIDNNGDVLNILVPLKYKKFEFLIEDSYQKWFYFQKIDVANYYREDSNLKKIEKNIDELKINIIWAADNQHYFTYNQYSGDQMNTITDPIVTVYTQNIDNSCLAACLGGSMLLESADEYSALKEVSAVTQKYDVSELNTVTSIYDQKGEEIKNLEDSIDSLILNTAVVFLLLIMFMAVITYAYYKTFLPAIIIKSLYGYRFASIYKYLILTNLLINLAVIPASAIIYKKISLSVLLTAGLISALDYLTAAAISGYLLKKGELSFIKGELK